VAITQAGSVSGRIITGIVSDYVGVWNVFGAVGFISATVMFAFWTPPNIGTAPTILGLIFWGMISGAWFTLVGSATAHISPVQETGMRFGMLISALAIPSFVGPIICGGEYLFQLEFGAFWSGSWRLPLVAIAPTSAKAAIVIRLRVLDRMSFRPESWSHDRLLSVRSWRLLHGDILGHCARPLRNYT